MQTLKGFDMMLSWSMVQTAFLFFYLIMQKCEGIPEKIRTIYYSDKTSLQKCVTFFLSF